MPRQALVFTIIFFGILLLSSGVEGAVRCDSVAAVMLQSGEGIPSGKDSTARVPQTLFQQMPVADTVRYLHQWRLNRAAWQYEPVQQDTAFLVSHLFDDRVQFYRPYTHLSLRYAPMQYDEFFARRAADYAVSPSFLGVWEHLEAEHSNYVAQGPYSHFNAAKDFGSGEGELYARWFYTQNLAPGLNFGFNIMHADDLATMVNLKSRYNVGSLFASFVQRRFYASGSVAIRRMEHSLNGGMTSTRWLLDTVVAQGQFPVYHTNNNTQLAQNRFTLETGVNLLQGAYTRTDSTQNIRYIYQHPTLTLLLLQSYRKLARAYVEPTPPAGRSYNIADNYTHDSVASQSYDARLGLAYRHNEHGKYYFPSLRAWLGYTYDSYSQPQPLLYLRGYAQKAESSMYIGANLEYRLPYMRFSANGILYGVGARAGDAALNASLWLHPFQNLRDLNLALRFSTVRTNPSYFEQHHYSNTQNWELADVLKPTTYLHSEAELHLPWADTRLGIRNRLYRQYTYFNLWCVPAQVSTLNVLAGYLQEDFRWMGVNVTSRLVLQHSSQASALALPLFTAYGSVGYELEAVPEVLRLRIALECIYRSQYYADTYNVPLGIYHRQYTFQLGNYPFMDVVLNVKWKSANLFVMVGHLNEDWFGRNSFSSVGYPERERGFRFGFQWYFYTPQDEEKAF